MVVANMSKKSKGRGWHDDRHEHSLAAMGIKTKDIYKYKKSINPNWVKTELPPVPKYVDYEGEYENRYKKERKVLDYPPGMKENVDRRRYNEEMENANTPEERQAIYDKWEKWKAFKDKRQGPFLKTKVYPVAKVDDYPWLFVTNANSPPDGYRWINEEDMDKDEKNIIGFVDYKGKFSPGEDGKITFKSLSDYHKEKGQKEKEKEDSAYSYLSKEKQREFKPSPLTEAQKQRKKEMEEINKKRLEAWKKAKEKRKMKDSGIDYIE